MATETVIQQVGENPEIEAYRIGLLESATQLADQGITVPTQQVAGLTGLQTAAAKQAEAGLGAFMPYLTTGGQTLGTAGQTLGGVESALRAGAGPVTCTFYTSDAADELPCVVFGRCRNTTKKHKIKHTQATP